MKEFPSEIIEIIAVGDTIIFNFPLSIFNSAAEWLPGKLKFETLSAKIPPEFSPEGCFYTVFTQTERTHRAKILSRG